MTHTEWITLPTARHAMHGHAADPTDGTVTIQVPYKNGEQSFSATALLGMLLGKIRDAAVEKQGAADAVCLPVSGAAAPVFADAACIAGFKRALAFPAAECIVAAYAKKHPVPKGSPPRMVAFLDVGHHRAAFFVASFTAEGGGGGAAEGGGDAMDVDSGAAARAGAAAAVAAAATGVTAAEDLALGAGAFDAALFDHLSKQVKEKYGETIEPATKRGRRLVAACAALRKLLSTLPEAATTAENLCDDRDVPLTLSRDEMAIVCAPLLARLEALVFGALAAVGISDAASEIHTVELLGGGSRMPVVQAVANKLGAPMGTRLDDAAAAYGAVLLAQWALDADPDAHQAGNMSPEALAAAAEAEAAMLREDEAVRATADVRNAIESTVFDMRGAVDREHGKLIDKARLLPYLESVEEWLYSDEASPETTSLEVLQAKLAEVRAAVRDDICAEFFRVTEAERRAVEEGLEAAAREAEKDREERGEDAEGDDDHDFRKLKKSDRQRLVQKNKDEGNELFAHGNYRIAGARYTKALTHCAKFVDLSPEEEKEVAALRLSLYLNLAQVYLKTQNWDAAINNCTHALGVDPKSAKALYR
ncbi:unnamed protein product [Phaeothamnion confervicola]